MEVFGRSMLFSPLPQPWSQAALLQSWQERTPPLWSAVPSTEAPGRAVVRGRRDFSEAVASSRWPLAESERRAASERLSGLLRVRRKEPGGGRRDELGVVLQQSEGESVMWADRSEVNLIVLTRYASASVATRTRFSGRCQTDGRDTRLDIHLTALRDESSSADSAPAPFKGTRFTVWLYPAERRDLLRLLSVAPWPSALQQRQSRGYACSASAPPWPHATLLDDDWRGLGPERRVIRTAGALPEREGEPVGWGVWMYQLAPHRRRNFVPTARPWPAIWAPAGGGALYSTRVGFA